ncbi:hypothetical protein BDV27DRAFT_119758 [Aspergillus caelatus]|uniref:Uncharacterized protein n=1 Tax=Aspergillus caelatus TaxID=61420 RepID=A0A5N7AKC0_9EURO|nr:uncharacterized protein BDV27DRAFT_119758 [Aspergillus caelatus]KAE8370163.1 hypothetical protein BDV27DRAFT_119758 [Aspergillus caelatus]
MSKVVQVWFGKDDAYIISMGNGRYIWDLRGHYSKLHDKLKSTKGLDIRVGSLGAFYAWLDKMLTINCRLQL